MDDDVTRASIANADRGSWASSDAYARGEVATTAEGLRRQNLARLVQIFHRFGPLSRARVTKITGFSRTAVGRLLGDLVDLGILVESDAHRSERVGRPSAQFAPNPRLVGVVVNTDVRGLHVGFARLSGELIDSRYVPLTHRPSAEAAAEIIASLVQERRRDHPEERLLGVGVAVPGRVDAAGRTVTWAPHVRWSDVPLADLLEQATGLPTKADFDAHLGVITESAWGTASGSNNTAYIYGGPGGLGAAVIADGESLVGGRGLAARLGHVTVDAEGALCECGSKGCLESSMRFAEYENALGDQLVSFAELGSAIRSHRSPAIDEILDRHARLLGRALRTIVLAYDPDVILLGGFTSVILEHRRAELEAAITAGTLLPVRQPAAIEQARFGATLLLVGASTLAFSQLLNDPTSIADPTAPVTEAAL